MDDGPRDRTVVTTEGLSIPNQCVWDYTKRSETRGGRDETVGGVRDTKEGGVQPDDRMSVAGRGDKGDLPRVLEP